MKVEITKSGVLLVTAETGTESFALECWANKAIVNRADIVTHEHCFVRGSYFVACCDVLGSRLPDEDEGV